MPRPKPVKEKPPTTWDETIDRFLARLRERRRSANTIRSYGDELKRFGEPALLSEIQESDLSVWMASLVNRGLEHTSINTKLATLQSLFKWGRLKGWMEPLETPDWLKLKAATCHWLEVKQEARLVRAVEKEGVLRDRALITFLLRCGLRVSEAAQAKVSHFTLDEPDPEIEVMGKGNRPRTVPLPSPVVKLLTKLIKTQDFSRDPDPADPHVFQGQRGPLTTAGLYEIVTYYAGKAKLGDVTPHSLRHTCGKRMNEDGKELTEIAKILGHASIVTTSIYVTPGKKDLKAALRRRTDDPAGDDDDLDDDAPADRRPGHRRRG
jgi:integrase/recombinase XerD